MLLAVTDYCSMGCQHCFGDHTTAGAHITREQLIKNLEFAYSILKNIPLSMLMITGGEPFEHPHIREVLEVIGQYNKKYPKIPVTIATNGYTMANDIDLMNWYREYVKSHKSILTQVTAVKEFYPKHLTDKNLYYLGKIKNCTVIDEAEEIFLYPQGRALNLEDPIWQTNAPKCVNMRLIANQLPTSDFNQIIQTLTSMNKYCTPRINVDGSISMGESALCPPIGTVDRPELLFENIKNSRCGKCSIPLNKLKNTVPELYNLIMEG